MCTRKYHWRLIIGLLAMPCMLLAQSPALRYFSDEDGLPGMTVYEIKQDPSGYLWMATNKGICKFDGREFHKFHYKGLKSNDTPYSFMDEEGTPWFYNLAGEILYVKNDTIKKLELPKIHPSPEIYSLFIFNKFLYITWSKLIRPETYKYSLNDLSKYQKINRNYIFLGVKNKELLAYDLDHMSDSIIIYSVENNKKLIDLPIPKKSKQKLILEIFKYRKHSNNNDLYLTANYLNIFNNNNKLIDQIYMPDLVNEKIKFMSFINENEIFLSTNKSCYTFSIQNKKLSPYNKLGNFINTIFEDNLHRIWVSTSDHGLILDLNKGSTIYTNSNSLLASNEIATIYVKGEKIYTGHNTGKISIISPLEKKINTLEISGSGKIRYINEYSKNNFLIGTDVGLYELDLAYQRQKTCPGLNIGSFKAAMITPDNYILQCTSLGIYQSNLQSLIKNLCNQFIKSRQLEIRTQCITMFENKPYAGTYNGLFKQINKHKWERALNKEVFINSIYNYKDSILYICSDGEGVFFYSGGNITQQLNQENGLPSNNVSSLTHINEELIAIGTVNGVYIYNISSKKGFYLDKLDGLPGNEITDIKPSKNYLWIGTTKGLYKIPKNQIKPNLEEPYINVENAQVISRKGTFNFTNQLNFYENHIRFTIGCRSLVSGNKVKIFYKINNLDEIWNEANSNVVELIGLSPGNYQLTMKAINEDGIQSNLIKIPFTIKQALWKTTWFTLIVLICLITLSIVITYSRQIHIRKEEARKRKIQEEINLLREEALQNQMNPHFIFNALNAIQSLLSSNDQLKAMNYLSKFGRLIRMIFEQSRQKRISLENEIEFINHYLELESLRFGEKIEISFIIDTDVKDIAPELMIPPILIQPIIENAFKHGLLHKEKGGKLKVHFQLFNSQLCCTIEDNGIGRKNASKLNQWKNKGRKSTGISSTMERLALLDNGANRIGLDIIDLYDKDGFACGTKAIIIL